MTQAEQRPDENSSDAQAEIERLKQELDRSRDMHRRTLADFDNYRKRMQRDWDGAAQVLPQNPSCRGRASSSNG
jgi:molecular chaperone GrpE (heat shock protein)